MMRGLAGTLEDHLLDLLHAKINMFELVIGEIDAIIGHLEEEGSFEEVLMNLWCSQEKDFSQTMEELSHNLLEAKRSYIQTREVEDRIFGNDLATEEQHV
jgi:hypothetical protein